MTGTYIGPREELKGCTALLMYPPMHIFHGDITHRQFMAQFDDLERFGEGSQLQLAHGWHAFRLEDFAVEFHS